MGFFTPDGYFKSVTQIPVSLLQQRGIRGVLFDLDNTITTWNQLDCSQEVKEWFIHLQEAGIKACILSNNCAARVEPVASVLNISFVAEAKKPFPNGYRRGMAVLGISPQNALMVGDQLLTDIAGAKRLGICCFLVEPISTEKEYWFTTYVNRPLERWLLRRKKLQA